MADVLFRDPERDLVLEVSDRPEPAYVALLDQTVWGTHGLRFRVLGIQHELDRWKRGHFLSLKRAGQTVATFLIVPRTYEVDGFRFEAGYRTMLAVAPGNQDAGLGKVITSHAKRIFLDEARGPRMLYGFIEQDNERSMKLQLKLGYEPLTTFQAVTFGPLRPRRIEVEPLAPGDVGEVEQAIAEQLRGHVLADTDQSFVPEEYFVLRRDGRIVAGAQVVPKHMTVRHLAGASGWILMRSAPLLAAMSRFFQLEGATYVWCGNVFWRGDDATPLAELLEGVIARHGAGQAVLYLDPRSPIRAGLAKVGLGITNTLSPNPTLHFLAGWRDVPDRVVDAIRSRPLATSPLDCA